MNQYDQQASDFLTKFGLTFHAVHAAAKLPSWETVTGTSDQHWRVTFKRRSAKHGLRKTLSFDFFNSIAATDRDEPLTAYQVLSCLSSDVTYTTLDDYFDSFGGNRDSLRELRTAKTVVAFGKRLQAFFTPDECRALLEIA